MIKVIDRAAVEKALRKLRDGDPEAIKAFEESQEEWAEHIRPLVERQADGDSP